MSGKPQVGAPTGDTEAGRGDEKTLRVSQIVVSLILLNEHDAPITPEPVIFAGDDNGTAAENLTAWITSLPVQLELAAAQLEAPAEENGKP